MDERSGDPVVENPGLYRVVFENERVRVLEYRDVPGTRTTRHRHPDSVMVALSAFRRLLLDEERSAEVELRPGVARWLDAQDHAGENIGDTDSYAIFVELLEPRPGGSDPGPTQLGARAG